MHDYAVFGHSRATIGRYLGTASVILTGLISSVILWLHQVDGLSFMAGATVSTAVVYFALHWTFNNYVWKVPLFKIPDLNGVEFKKEGDNVLIMVGGSATSYIRIDNKDLKILYMSNGKTWTANGTR